MSPEKQQQLLAALRTSAELRRLNKDNPEYTVTWLRRAADELERTWGQIEQVKKWATRAPGVIKQLSHNQRVEITKVDGFDKEEE